MGCYLNEDRNVLDLTTPQKINCLYRDETLVDFWIVRNSQTKTEGYDGYMVLTYFMPLFFFCTL